MKIDIIDNTNELTNVYSGCYSEKIFVITSEIPIDLKFKQEVGERIYFSKYLEYGLSPKKQLNKFYDILNNSNCDVLVFLTNSDYIVKELNINIMKKRIDFRTVFSYTYLENGDLIENDINELGVEIDMFDDIINQQNMKVDELVWGNEK